MSSDRSEKIAATKQRILNYSNLKYGWADEGSKVPKPEAIADAIRFLEATPNCLEIPTAEIQLDGDVALCWDSENIFAEMGFSGNGRYYAYVSVVGKNTIYLDDVPMPKADLEYIFPEIFTEAFIKGAEKHSSVP